MKIHTVRQHMEFCADVDVKIPNFYCVPLDTEYAIPPFEQVVDCDRKAQKSPAESHLKDVTVFENKAAISRKHRQMPIILPLEVHSIACMARYLPHDDIE